MSTSISYYCIELRLFYLENRVDFLLHLTHKPSKFTNYCNHKLKQIFAACTADREPQVSKIRLRSTGPAQAIEDLDCTQRVDLFDLFQDVQPQSKVIRDSNQNY